MDIFSDRISDNPGPVIHTRVDLGHSMSFVVNEAIVIEDDANVTSGETFMDTDAHPRELNERISDLPPRAEEIRPARICRNV